MTTAAAPRATMRTPAFFDDVPTITLADPLAETLGAAEGGIIEYDYLDAVKLAGHSCPTVAGAWLMTRKALAQLYPDRLPRRGEIRVELQQALDDGVAGVIGAVAGLVTGACNEGGFKGLAGRHGRKGLLRYGVPMRGEIRFTRLDNGATIELTHKMTSVPRPEAVTHWMPRALGPQGDATALAAFGAAWQDWVRTILLEHADDPAVVIVVA